MLFLNIHFDLTTNIGFFVKRLQWLSTMNQYTALLTMHSNAVMCNLPIVDADFLFYQSSRDWEGKNQFSQKHRPSKLHMVNYFWSRGASRP